eukprot:1033793-Alexandrium_andersonii.AAC.1
MHSDGRSTAPPEGQARAVGHSSIAAAVAVHELGFRGLARNPNDRRGLRLLAPNAGEEHAL